MEQIRKEFPVLRKCIYANTAVFGPFYESFLEWRQEHDLDFLLHASDMRHDSLTLISDTRKTIAAFFACESKNVALINNLSTGMNMLLEGLDKKHGILLLENDYPSVNWPFENRAFRISYVPITENLEGDIREAVRMENISVLALSLVQWQNGIRIDLEFLHDLKKEFPDLLVLADGTQFCGMTHFNFGESAIDVLGTSAYKWLLAGYGSGFLLLKDGLENQFSINTIGFNAANGDVAQKDNIPFAKRFEPGHLSCLSFGSLKFSLDFMMGIGMDRIEQQNKRLAEKARKEFSALGLLEEVVVARKTHSTIFNISGDEALFQELSDNNVVCSKRGGGIRLSFHFYNTEKEIDAIVKIIKTAS